VKRKTKVLMSLVCMVSLFFSFSLVAQASPGKSKAASHRFYGQDRFQTSTSIANELDDGQQVQNIVLASAYNFPDALSASTLAYQLKAPIILVSPGHKDSMISYNFVKEHLVAGGTVTIVGGTGIISKKSEEWLLDNGFRVNRLGGKDRFDTNALIVNQLNVPHGTPVIIASGTDFPDALGISSLAASKGWPILLSNPSNLTQAVQGFLTSDQPTDVYIVGGEGIVHNGVYNQILTLSPSSTIQRLGGYDRFETLSLILNKFYPSPVQIYVANGFDFADALSGSTLAATNNAPILLVDPKSNNLPRSIYDYLITLRNNNVHPQVNVLGGEAAVPQRLLDQINDILQNGGETTTPSETLAVSNPSTTGFIVEVNPALNGLHADDFILMDGSARVTISSILSTNSGATYKIAATLMAGHTYSVTAIKSGFYFGAAQNVAVPLAATVSSAAMLDSRHIRLTMNNALTGTIGDPAAFMVASGPTVTNVEVYGTTVTLTLSSAIVSTDAYVTLSYAKTGIYDLTNGDPVANFGILVGNQ